MNKIENDNLIKLVFDARDGVDGAFEKLYAESIKFSYGIARMLLKNEEDIEDVLQNSYMYVAGSIKNIKNPESFESWLGTIVRHECQKHIAKRKRISEIFTDRFASKEIELISFENTAYELMEKRDTNESIRKIVEKLPDDKRACVVLFYFEQNSVPEIAEILGIPEGTVKSRLYNARKILEKEFKKLRNKDETFYGLSVIPLVAAFFAYQSQNIAVPASIAERASVCLAAAGGTAAVSTASAASAASVTSGGTAGTAASAAGTVAAGVTTKVAAVAVAAAVATGGGIATVNYVNHIKEAETTLSAILPTEEFTTFAAEFSDTTAAESTETTMTSESIVTAADKTDTTAAKTESIFASTHKNENSKASVVKSTKSTTLKNTTKPVTTAEMTTAENTTNPETTTQRISTTKEETTKNITTTAKPVTNKSTTSVPVTKDEDIYAVSDGVLDEYTGKGNNVSIPSSVGGNTVTAIGAGAFAGNEDIASVSVPSSITRIGQEAFADCTNLKSVSLPSSLNSIGIGAFCGCTSLESVGIPNGVTLIGDDAFADCSTLETVTVPSTVTSIGDNAFGGCDGLTIKCSEGSAAYDYAIENSISYELI